MLASHLPRFRRARRTMDAMRHRESWDRSQIEAFQLRRLNALWESSIRSVPFYQRLQSKYELPGSFATLGEFQCLVPTLSKEQVRSDPRSFLSHDRYPGRWHRTGGSTGVPMRVFWSHAAHREMLCCKYLQARDFGVDIFGRTVFVWGHAESFSPGVRGRVDRFFRPTSDMLRNRLRLSAYHLDQFTCAEHLRRIRAFRPHLIYAYSSALEQLARCNDRSSSFDDLRVCVVTAEPAPEPTIRRIQESFGVETVIEYGSVECGIIACEGRDRVLRIREDVCFVEALKVDATYELIVTVLNNPAFPLIRYAIGDHTSGPIRRPTTGLSMLSDVIGRDNDFLTTACGKHVHPNAIKHIFEQSDVGRFRCHQQPDGKLLVLLEHHTRASDEMQKRWIDQLSRLLEGTPVEIKTVPRLLPNRAGKHRFVISESTTAARGRLEAE